MTRRPLAAAALLLLAAAACGPDCDRYCRKVQECRGVCGGPAVDAGACLTACNDAGSSRSATIQCVIDHSCKDLAAGHCSVTGSGFSCASP